MGEFSIQRADGATWRGYLWTSYKGSTYPGPTTYGWPDPDWVGNDETAKAQLRAYGWEEGVSKRSPDA